MSWPYCEAIDSGWNCTPCIGKLLWDNPIITPSSVSAVTSSSLGRVDLSTISEWYRVASIGLGKPWNNDVFSCFIIPILPWTISWHFITFPPKYWPELCLEIRWILKQIFTKTSPQTRKGDKFFSSKLTEIVCVLDLASSKHSGPPSLVLHHGKFCGGFG